MSVSYVEMLPRRSILDMVSESIHDIPLNDKNNWKQSQGNYTENNIRYKLIIDNSEDDSAVRYLLTSGVLDQCCTSMVACSDFPEESRMHVSYSCITHLVVLFI